MGLFSRSAEEMIHLRVPQHQLGALVWAVLDADDDPTRPSGGYPLLVRRTSAAGIDPSGDLVLIIPESTARRVQDALGGNVKRFIEDHFHESENKA